MKNFSKKQREEIKRFDEITNNTYICKCGCRSTISAQMNYVVCRWCGNLVFKNSKDEFEHKLRSEIYRNKRRSK